MSIIRKKLINKEAGFTLIELLVVVGVLGILAAIAIPRVSGMNDKARLSEAQAAIGSIRTALEMVYTDKNSYAFADTNDAYKSAATLLADTALDEYLDNISDNWNYNIDAVADNYLIEVIGSGSGNYKTKLKASLTKGEEKITTDTENDNPDPGTL